MEWNIATDVGSTEELRRATQRGTRCSPQVLLATDWRWPHHHTVPIEHGHKARYVRMVVVVMQMMTVVVMTVMMMMKMMSSVGGGRRC